MFWTLKIQQWAKKINIPAPCEIYLTLLLLPASILSQLCIPFQLFRYWRVDLTLSLYTYQSWPSLLLFIILFSAFMWFLPGSTCLRTSVSNFVNRAARFVIQTGEYLDPYWIFCRRSKVLYYRENNYFFSILFIQGIAVLFIYSFIHPSI